MGTLSCVQYLFSFFSWSELFACTKLLFMKLGALGLLTCIKFIVKWSRRRPRVQWAAPGRVTLHSSDLMQSIRNNGLRYVYRTNWFLLCQKKSLKWTALEWIVLGAMKFNEVYAFVPWLYERQDTLHHLVLVSEFDVHLSQLWWKYKRISPTAYWTFVMIKGNPFSLLLLLGKIILVIINYKVFIIGLEMIDISLIAVYAIWLKDEHKITCIRYEWLC